MVLAMITNVFSIISKKISKNILQINKFLKFSKKIKEFSYFFFKKKIITIDESIVSQIGCDQYFTLEIKPFLTEKFISKYINSKSYIDDDEFIVKEMMEEVPNEFYEKREEGENDSHLCELIRKDDVKEFSAYANRQNISFDKNIKNSTFETNHFLYYPSGICLNIIGKIYFNLVEYTAFFGSISITNYMRINWEVELTPFMWLSAIHSQNAELIKYLEKKFSNQI